MDPGAVSASKSVIYGTANATGIFYTRLINAIENPTGRSGELQYFYIKTRDKFGNDITTDIAQWKAIVEPKPYGRGIYTEGNVTYVGLGIYLATYRPSAADQLLLNVYR